jgi:tRNA modification GTPase
MIERLDPSDTIAAIATAPGPAARGIVRLSGPAAWEIALSGFAAQDVPRPDSRHASRFDGRLSITGPRVPLRAAISLWPGPKTYTGQQLAEIHTTGSPPILQRLLADCLERGARLAEPGEFTLRAFLTGRIDLTQAEAVLGVIEAANPRQLEMALSQLAGGLATPLHEMRDRWLDSLAHLEAGLDFVDEADVNPIARAELAATLAAASSDLTELALRLEARDRPDGLPRVVLIGPPNAGKSRLFNALVGQRTAIVSPEAGTTRDYLSAVCDCDGRLVEIFDTAGIEIPEDEIRGRAQQLGTDASTSADLLLDCGSADSGFTDSAHSSRLRLRVGTKCDVTPSVGASLQTSAQTGEGIGELRCAIRAALFEISSDSSCVAATGARCRESLVQASRALRSASETLMLGGGDELVAVDLRQAVDELGKVIGAVVSDDILDRIFRRFCIGK